MSRSNARRIVLRALAAHERWPLSVQGALAVGLFLVAFSVRSLHAVDLAPVMESRSQPGVRMATRYDAAADAILRGEGVFFPEHVDPHDTALLARPPGYPLLLAGIYSSLGRSFYAVGVFQNVVDSLAVLVLFFIGSRVVSYRVGLVAALLLALGHFSAFYANLITPDTLCVLPILLAVAVLVRVRPRRPLSFLPYCAAGILLGLSCWLRPNTLVLGPFAALLFPLIYGGGRPQILRAAVLAVTGLLVVAPITLRNYRIYGTFVPISVNMGIVLWEGIADGGGERFGAKGRDYEVAWQESQEHQDARYAEWWASPDGIARDRERIRKSLSVIGAHPFWFARATASRALQMLAYGFDEPPFVLVSSPDVSFEVAKLREPEPICLDLGARLGWARRTLFLAQRALKSTLVPTLAVGLAGVLLASPRRTLFLALVPLSVLLFQSPLHLEFRVTLPMHALLLVFSGAGIVLLASGLAAAFLGRRRLRSGG
jgi:hypothetical protein